MTTALEVVGMDTKKLVVIDTETDRLDGEEGAAAVVELAAVTLRCGAGGWSQEAPTRSWLFAPGEGGVTARASAIHHLTDDSLVGCVPFNADHWRLAMDGADCAVAHNAEFDRTQVGRVLTHDDIPLFICTLKCARVAWPEAPAYGNQVLRYYRRLTGLVPANLYPHRAAYDAIVTSWLLIDLLAHFENDLERMVKISYEPSLLTKVTFGKHRGMRWSEVPNDWLRWVLRSDFGKDEHHTARYWVNR